MMIVALMAAAASTAFAGDSDALKSILKAKTYAEAVSLVNANLGQLADNAEKAKAYNKLVDLAIDKVSKEQSVIASNQMAEQMGTGKVEQYDTVGFYDAVLDAFKAANECEKYDLESFAIDDTHKYHEQDGVDFIDSAAAYDAGSGELTVFVINRDWEDCADFTLDITGLTGMRFEGHTEMFNEKGVSTDGADQDLAPVPATDTVCDDMTVKAELKPLSWNVFRFVKA